MAIISLEAMFVHKVGDQVLTPSEGNSITSNSRLGMTLRNLLPVELHADQQFHMWMSGLRVDTNRFY